MRFSFLCLCVELFMTHDWLQVVLDHLQVHHVHGFFPGPKLIQAPSVSPFHHGIATVGCWLVCPGPQTSGTKFNILIRCQDAAASEDTTALEDTDEGAKTKKAQKKVLNAPVQEENSLTSLSRFFLKRLMDFHKGDGATSSAHGIKITEEVEISQPSQVFLLLKRYQGSPSTLHL